MMCDCRAGDEATRHAPQHHGAGQGCRQAVIAGLAQRAVARPDLTMILEEAVTLVARTLDVAYCAVLELLPDGTALRMQAGVGWNAGLVGQGIVYASAGSQAGYTLTSREPVIVHDLRSETRFHRSALLDEHGAVSGMSTVIPGPEQPFGILEAYATRRRLFTADDAYFLQAVAGVLALAGAHTRAEAARRISEQRLRAVFEQSPMGLISYAPNGVLLEANEVVLDALPPQQAAGYNVLEDRWLEAAGVMDDIRRAFAGDVVRLAPLYVDPARLPGPRERWVRSVLHPVKDEAGAVREVMAMVEDITEQVQSYELLEQRVAERTHELSTLLEVSHDVASTLELEPLLGLILDRLKGLVGFSGATIQTLEGEDLTVLDFRGPIPRVQMVGRCIPLDRGGAEVAVIHGREPVIRDDVRGDTALVRAYYTATGRYPDHVELIRAWMGVPLLLKDRVIGLVTLVHDEPGHYTPRHAALALAMANQAAVAIENARLYQRAQEGAALEERARLARELHDAVTQTLFSASLIAELVPRLWDRDPEAGRQRLEDVRLLTRGALAEMRTLLLELRPAALTDAKLSDLLSQLAAALTGRKRLPVTLSVDGECPLPPDVQVALYRVAQEALHNIAKHARATAVELFLRCDGKVVELRIDDNGRGFDPGQIASDHFGLRIMRERADAIGARLTIQSRPGAGTHVQAVWRKPGKEGGP